MKAYEVFPCVPYYDPDDNKCYYRKEGVFFFSKDKAEEYLHKMFDDKETNKALGGYYYPEESKRRYVSPSDYVEPEISYERYCCDYSLEKELSEDQKERLRKIYKTNRLVDELRYRNSMLLAVAYYGIRWFLREIEIN